MKSHFINGKWIEGSGSEFVSINPAVDSTREEAVVWRGKEATEAEVNDAMMAARNAFDAWASKTVDERVAYLQKFSDLLAEHRDELAELMSEDTGKAIWESKMEMGGAIGKLKVSIKAYEDRAGTKSKEMNGKTMSTRHKPHGVVLVYGPFNFPVLIPHGHILPALLAGNTIVYKPSEQTPLIAQRVFELWEQVGLPAGVLNLVQGAKDTGIALSQHPELDGLFFTGSSQTGGLLHKQFGGQPGKILALEMGGNNPLIVFEASDLDAAAYVAIQSSYITTGQRCVCARRLIVPEGADGDKFIEKFQAMAESIQAGAYDSKPEPFVGPLISADAAKKALASQQELIAKGGKVLLEMKQTQANTGFVSPGLIDMTGIDRDDIEIFAPLVQIIRVKDFAEAMKEANDTGYGLSAGLISDNKKLYEEFFRKSRAGIVNWNNQITGASGSSPFGGVGCSGNHRASAYYAADYCSYPIASIDSSKAEIPEETPPGLGLKVTN